MKKEESNIGQLSLFDVIDGGKHGEAENVNLIKIKHKIHFCKCNPNTKSGL